MGIIQPNIELYLPFESTLPSLGTDASGNGNNGVVYGVTQGVGKIGGAGVFDGINDYIDCGASATLRPATQITIISWVKCANVNTGGYAMSIGNNQQFAYNSFANAFRFAIRTTTSGFTPLYVDGIDVTIWNHFALTYDGTGSKVYHNGILVASDLKTGNILYANTLCQIGKNTVSASGFFNGSLSKLKIFNIALSEQNIRREMIGLNALI